MKHAIFLCIMFMLGCGSTTQKYRTDFPVATAYKSAYLASVTISGMTNDTKAIGSGVIVRHQKGKRVLILTAGHVVKSLMEKQEYDPEINPSVILSYNSDVKLVKVHRYDEKDDLAVLISLKPAEEDGPVAELAEKNPDVGGKMFTIGSPASHRLTLTTGIVSNYYIEKKVLMYRVTAPMFFGNSGGGVWHNDKLIGIVHGIQAVQNFGFVPGGYFVTALPHLKKILKDS